MQTRFSDTCLIRKSSQEGKALDWNPDEVSKMKDELAQHEKILKSHTGKDLENLAHDPLTLKGGSTRSMLTAWWFLGRFNGSQVGELAT
jgi:hypothetical protein